MKQSLVYRVKEVFPGSVTINNRAFNTVDTREKSVNLKKDCFECPFTS